MSLSLSGNYTENSTVYLELEPISITRAKNDMPTYAGWDSIAVQGEVAIQNSREKWRYWIKSQGLLDDGLDVRHVHERLLRNVGLPLANSILHFLQQLLLRFRMP